MNNMNDSRRKLLQFAVASSGLALLPNLAWAGQINRQKEKRLLNIKSLNTLEELNIEYFDGKKYIQQALTKIAYLCRDRRTQEVHYIDPAVLDQLHQIHQHFGVDKQILLICGYRSPESNAQMHEVSRSVAKKSLHMMGQAIDFRIDNIDLRELREHAVSLQAGGVGYYPRSNFIHIDNGIVRTWPRNIK